MANELALTTTTAVAPRTSAFTGCDVPDTLADMARLAELLTDASMLPKHYQGSPSNVLVGMLKARALDVPLMVGLENIYIVNGTASISSALAHTLAERAGYQVRITESSTERATARLIRPDGTFEEFTYTIIDAKTAGLSSKDIWVKNPRPMLIHRAVGSIVRLHAPHVTMGMAIQDAADEILAANPVPETADSVTVVFINDILDAAAKTTTVEEMRAVYERAADAKLLGEKIPGGGTVKSKLLARAEEIKSKPVVEDAIIVEDALPMEMPLPTPVNTPDVTKSIKARAAKLAEAHRTCMCDPGMLSAVGKHEIGCPEREA